VTALELGPQCWDHPLGRLAVTLEQARDRQMLDDITALTGRTTAPREPVEVAA
jgi:hypothetical protein